MSATALSYIAIGVAVVSVIISLVMAWQARRALKRAERAYRTTNELRHSLARGAWEWPVLHDTNPKEKINA